MDLFERGAWIDYADCIVGVLVCASGPLTAGHFSSAVCYIYKPKTPQLDFFGHRHCKCHMIFRRRLRATEATQTRSHICFPFVTCHCMTRASVQFLE